MNGFGFYGNGGCYIVMFKLPGDDFWRRDPSGFFCSHRSMSEIRGQLLLSELERKYGRGVEVETFESE